MPLFKYNNMKRIQDSYEYKIVKQITSKENKKAMKKAMIEMAIFMGIVYIGSFLFVKLAFFIWRG
tara:strand:- start:5317 stop:5511 length:195 start_codon:yes stop_codon:yes gene_type:complete